MEYQSSQYDYLLILNIALPIYLESHNYIYIKTPSFAEYYENIGYRRLEALFLTDLSELEESAYEIGFIAENYSDILTGIRMRAGILEDDKLMELELDALRIFELMTGAKVEKDGIWFNGVELTEQDILEVRAALLMSLMTMDLDGNLRHKQNSVRENESELQRKMRESQERIDAIKGADEDQVSIEPADQIKIIVYELRMPISEIRNLNQYGIAEFYKVAAGASYDNINQIAAGNALFDKDKPYRPMLPMNNKH